MIVGSPRAACSTKAGKFLRASSAPFLAGVFMGIGQMRLKSNYNCTLCTDSCQPDSTLWHFFNGIICLDDARRLERHRLAPGNTRSRPTTRCMKTIKSAEATTTIDEI